MTASKLEERFFKYVNKTASCWLWTGYLGGKYGRLVVNGRAERAHRVSYWLFVGKIGEGLQVLHRCDVKACVNPSHLYLGTVSDNLRDAYARGQKVQPRGESHPDAILTWDKVREIRRLKPFTTMAKLAEKYKVSMGSISNVLYGRKWNRWVKS